MTLSAHKLLFSLIVLAALLGFGWVLIVYVMSFHAAQWIIDRLEGSPRRQLRTAPLRARPARRAVARVSRA